MPLASFYPPHDSSSPVHLLLTLTLSDLFEQDVTLRQRLIIAAGVAMFGASLIWVQYSQRAGFHTDFGMSWFGARSLLYGIDPYPLVGRGKSFDYMWPLTYPASSFVALLPFGLMSERVAATSFVLVSTFLLALGVTRRGLYLLPLFVSGAFLNAARLGQWNIALTAALFFPSIAFFGGAKPQAILPLLAGNLKTSSAMFFLVGSMVLFGVSFVLLPHWFGEWTFSIQRMPDTNPAITRMGGILILFVLLRWRRAESWLILTLACVPQTPALYSTLPIFTVAATLTESIGLVLTTLIGTMIGAFMVSVPTSMAGFNALMGSLQVFSIYIPAVIFILRRPNDGPMPWWMRIRYRKDAPPA